MMKKINTLFLILFTFATLILNIGITSNKVNAVDPKQAVCEGAGLVSDGSGNCVSVNTSGPTVDSTVQRALTLFSAIIGIIAVVMLMYGGLKFITSGGDSNATNSARNTIIYAAVGLVVVSLAQFIVKFVLARFQ